ncbi:hypothetical protein [Azotobacter beijerinckii]|uniref:hypothetical protein n=1 Tax=Azotobacter beijerinckii TaxID=170623 RepID=UPI000B84BE6B|nr:hypothetical protein [Azotobacter beijerinckii]
MGVAVRRFEGAKFLVSGFLPSCAECVEGGLFFLSFSFVLVVVLGEEVVFVVSGAAFGFVFGLEGLGVVLGWVGVCVRFSGLLLTSMPLEGLVSHLRFVSRC